MTSFDADHSNPVSLLKGLLFNDSCIEQIILKSGAQPVYLAFKFPRYHPSCQCKVEHEKIGYINNNDVINHATFEKICTAIEVGHCPHVAERDSNKKHEDTNMESGHQVYDKFRSGFQTNVLPVVHRSNVEFPYYYQSEVDDDDLEVARTSLLHVAAAVGNRNVVSHLITRSREIQLHIDMYSSGDYIPPWKIAVIRKQSCVLPLLLSNDTRSGEVMYRFYPIDKELYQDLQFLVRHDCKDGIHIMLRNIHNPSTLPFLDDLVRLTILYNRPSILGLLANYTSIYTDLCLSMVPKLTITSLNLAELLEYHECASEIQKDSESNTETLFDITADSVVPIITWVLGLRDTLRQDDTDVIAKTLKRLSEMISFRLDAKTSQAILLHTLACYTDSKACAVLLEDLGCDVNSDLLIRLHGPSTVLSESLRTYMDYAFLEHRQVVKTILNSNPRPDMNAVDVIRWSWAIDCNWQFSASGVDIDTYRVMCNTSESTVDCDTESLTRVLLDQRFCEMIFYVPTMYEHGFSLRPNMRGRRGLSYGMGSVAHPLLRLLYRSLISTPRSLKSRSRIVLRQAYPGRQIHEFVRESTLPVSIKEYILMSEELSKFSGF